MGLVASVCQPSTLRRATPTERKALQKAQRIAARRGCVDCASLPPILPCAVHPAVPGSTSARTTARAAVAAKTDRAMAINSATVAPEGEPRDLLRERRRPESGKHDDAPTAGRCRDQQVRADLVQSLLADQGPGGDPRVHARLHATAPATCRRCPASSPTTGPRSCATGRRAASSRWRAGACRRPSSLSRARRPTRASPTSAT